MTDAEMLTEAMRRAQPAAHSAFCYTHLTGLSAMDARDKVRGFDYALQDLRNLVLSGRAQMVE